MFILSFVEIGLLVQKYASGIPRKHGDITNAPLFSYERKVGRAGAH
jgi:hypothetical protein